LNTIQGARPRAASPEGSAGGVRLLPRPVAWTELSKRTVKQISDDQALPTRDEGPQTPRRRRKILAATESG